MPRIAGHIIAPPMPMRKRQARSTQAFGRESADQREAREDGGAGDEDAATAEHVGQASSGDDEDAEDHGVAVDDPLRRGNVGVEIALDGGQCDGERGEVVGDHQDGDAHGDHAENGCFAELVRFWICYWYGYRLSGQDSPENVPAVSHKRRRLTIGVLRFAVRSG